MERTYKLDSLEWNSDHTRNEQDVYCYCGLGLTSNCDYPKLIQCMDCKQIYHEECLKSAPGKLIYGDTFLNFKCAFCNKGKEFYQRSKINWLVITHLILYNVSYQALIKDPKACMYFKLKEDICDFLDANWSFIMGDRKRTTTWKNTISGSLSINKVFKNGFDDMQQSGWWGLEKFEPPKNMEQPSLDILPINKMESTKAQVKIASEIQVKSELKIEVKRKKVQIKENANKLSKIESNKPAYKVSNTIKEEDMFSSSSESYFMPDKYDNDLSGTSDESYIEENNKNNKNKNKNTTAVDNQNQFYYGMEWDGSYLNYRNYQNNFEQIQYTNAKSGLRDYYQNKIQSNKPKKQLKNGNTTVHHPAPNTSEVHDVIEDDMASTTHVDSSHFLDFLNQVENNSELKFMSQQQEWELLQKLQNSTVPLPPAARRLLRKLALKRTKRALNINEFNIDCIIFDYVHKEKNASVINVIENKPIDHFNKALLDLNQSKDSNLPTIHRKVKDFYINATPYENSFASRIYGNSNRLSIINNDIRISPYNQVVLKPFLRRIFSLPSNKIPVRLRLLYDIQNRNWKLKSNKNVNSKDQDKIELQHPIDFCYLEKWHLPQVNDLLCRMFWPGIDMKEALLYPEYSVIVLYKKLVIGCGFMSPSAYLTYLAVLPGFDKAGLGTFMLYHLIQTAKLKDVTLHVSANNKALLLYQKFTFKPEAFFVNFYHKYLQDQAGHHNALFCRLRQ